MQKQHSDARIAVDKTKNITFTMQKHDDVIESLESAVQARKPKTQITEWGDYYTDTNYTTAAMQAKIYWLECQIERLTNSGKKQLGIDLGANTGRFSLLLKKGCDTVVAADIDPVAVDYHYRELKHTGEANILPLIIDLTSPTPAIGWANKERMAFTERGKADIVLAFALCHHLRFTGGIPFSEMALFFKKILHYGGALLIEFVPREDSQVQRLLAARDDIFDDYTEEGFLNTLTEAGFALEEVYPMPETLRKLFVFKLNC